MSTEAIYLTSTHPEPLAYPIIVISLSDLFKEEGTDDEIFDRALQKLDPLIGDGYELIVLAAGSGVEVGVKGGRTSPGIGWWVSKWRIIPHRPQEAAMISIILPLISPKAYSKIHPIQSIFDLHHTYGVSLSGIKLPLAVLEEEARSKIPVKSTWTSSVTSVLGTVVSYIPFSHLITASPGYSRISTRSGGGGEGYWDRTLDQLVEKWRGVPDIFETMRRVILSDCITTEGIFRRTPGPHLRPVIIGLLDLPLDSQPVLPWKEIAISDPLLPPKILSALLARTSVPVIRQDQYSLIRRCTSLNHIKETFLPALSAPNRLVLSHVISTLHVVSQQSSVNRMTPLNLAICLAPDLIKGPDVMEDASLCLQPGKKMPQMGCTTSEGEGTLVGILELLIQNGALQ